MKLNNRIILATMHLIAAGIMLVTLIRLMYLSGLGILYGVAIGIPLFSIFALFLWLLPKTTKSKRTFFDRQFWLTGTLLCLFALILTGVQLYIVQSAADNALENAEAQVRKEFPELQWAFDELNKCHNSVGQYSGRRPELLTDCELPVIEIAVKRGDGEQLIKALEHFQEIIRDHRPMLFWPFTVI